jgi:putative ABC transport system permease protein
MFAYYLKLGLRSLRRNPVLTVLMVLTLAVGVATSMATLTVLRAMSGDPIPTRSERLFAVQVDNQPAPADGGDEHVDPHQSWLDLRALLEADVAAGLRRTALYAVGGVAEPGESFGNMLVGGMAVNADFFAMFDVPFAHGAAWSADADARGASEVVLSAEFATRLFGEDDPTGRTLRMFEKEYVIAGVLAPWRPMPKFYWLIGGPNRFGETDEVFIPLRNAIANESGPNGNVNCLGDAPEPGYVGLLNSECVFMQYWVELERASDRSACPATSLSKRPWVGCRWVSNRGCWMFASCWTTRKCLATTPFCRRCWLLASCWSASSIRWGCCSRSSRRMPARLASAARSARPAAKFSASTSCRPA